MLRYANFQNPARILRFFFNLYRYGFTCRMNAFSLASQCASNFGLTSVLYLFNHFRSFLYVILCYYASFSRFWASLKLYMASFVNISLIINNFIIQHEDQSVLVCLTITNRQRNNINSSKNNYVAFRQFIIELKLAYIHPMNILQHPTQNHSQNNLKGSPWNSTSEAYNQEKESNLPYHDNILNPQNQITCDQCRKNITSYTHVLCEEGDFCITCFACLDPIPSAYHVIGHLNFPLIDQKWSALEELLLINAVQRFGYGNWTDIKFELGESKTQQQIAEHYENLLKSSESTLQTLIFSTNKQLKVQRTPQKPEKAIVKSKNQLRMLKQQKSKYNMSLQENKLKILGHVPKRGDFQIQYDNELQLIISQMQFLQQDTPQTTRLKYKILNIFCERLNKRYQVKDFAVESRLLDLNELNRKERKRSKQEKETSALLQPFLRYMSLVDHQNLIMGITKENHLKQRISNQKQIKHKEIKNQTYIEQQSNLSRKRSISTKKKMNSKNNGSKLTHITQEEFHLCKKLQISQISFVLIKSTMKCQYLRNIHLEVTHFYNIFKLKSIFIDEIHTFLKQKGQLR